MIRFEQLSEKERETLFPLRASAWRARLTAEEFGERNRRLYQHPYGTTRIQTFALIDDKKRILSSMDLLRVSLLVSTNTEAIEGSLIASVITPPDQRKQGYATRLLDELFRHERIVAAVLHSDVGPPFYERWNFHATPAWGNSAPIEKGGPAPRNRVDTSAFCDFLNRERRRGLSETPVPGAALAADELWWDWIVERYRFFAELKGKPFPEGGIFWRCANEHAVAAAPDFVKSRLEGLWISPGCAECRSLLHALAADWGLPSIFFWREQGGMNETAECPMLFLEGKASPKWIDPQLGDWW